MNAVILKSFLFLILCQDLLVQRYIMQSQKWHTDQHKLAKRIDKEKIGFKFKRQYGTYPFKSA